MIESKKSDNSSESSFEANQPQDILVKSPKSSDGTDPQKGWDEVAAKLDLEESKETSKVTGDSKDQLIEELRAERDAYKAERDSFKQELVWFRSRVARLEE